MQAHKWKGLADPYGTHFSHLGQSRAYKISQFCFHREMGASFLIASYVVLHYESLFTQ